jgi:hypothetical protein
METVVTIVSMLGGVAGMGAYLHADIRRVETRLDAHVGRLDGRIERLDDRVYALATGLKPLIDDASRSESS